MSTKVATKNVDELDEKMPQTTRERLSDIFTIFAAGAALISDGKLIDLHCFIIVFC